MHFSGAFRAFVSAAGSTATFRLAPTPSGWLHAGNALNFILNWLAARHAGAGLLLRIDDLDADRKRPEFVRDIFESLEWLGLDWDLGPRDEEDFDRHWSQTYRMQHYRSALAVLRERGLLFACGKSRRDLAPYGGAYPAAFREQGLSLDADDVAWRIRTSEGLALQDFVVRRRDGVPAYQLASVVDDRLYGVTHVIRGADLEASTEAQRFLAECLGAEDFLRIQFLHHPLVLDEMSGAKLSKSEGASALRTMRIAGASPVELFRRVGALLELPSAACGSAAELLRAYRG